MMLIASTHVCASAVILTILNTDTKIEQSSQWDGFRHYSQPLKSEDPSTSQDRVFYGGTTKGEILDPSNHRIGLQYWAPEGIAGKSLIRLLSLSPFPSDVWLEVRALQSESLILRTDALKVIEKLFANAYMLCRGCHTRLV